MKLLNTWEEVLPQNHSFILCTEYPGVNSDCMVNSSLWLCRSPTQTAQVKRWQGVKGRVWCCLGELNAVSAPVWLNQPCIFTTLKFFRSVFSKSIIMYFFCIPWISKTWLPCRSSICSASWVRLCFHSLFKECLITSFQSALVAVIVCFSQQWSQLWQATCE